MAEPRNELHARRSDAIRIARVICIAGIVYVHAWTGLSGYDLELARGTPQETFRWILMEGFGRSAVPLLGLISGWLVAGSSRTRQWGPHVSRKARTILLPMVLWNALAVLLVSGAAVLFGLAAPVPQSWGWLFEELMIVTHPPDINVQMPFLRDLFLCMVIAPLLVRVPSRVLLLLAMAAGTCHVFGLGPPVILRASILMFFTLGIVARRANLAERAAAWPAVIALAPFVVLMPLHLYVSIGDARPFDDASTAAVDLAARVAASLAVWWLAWRLVATRAAPLLRRIEPYMFFYFCAHLILIWLFGPLIGKLTGKLGSPLYPVYLLAQPFLILGAVVAMAKALRKVAPGLAGVLSGGRLKAAS
ncbi:acyltransferase family protein [Novosphingobium guangzhouense]|uniref:Succinyltransferase n=1 Tax=Novosphingobium guangzhouense TaxID=1850347 RepID=A0A2K2G5J1_9SPHN|nr:acyltransferase [Novosphingobium guangzhouense]PNU06299.1 succinyltransferase [Novosphingobium guangzhouense]